MFVPGGVQSQNEFNCTTNKNILGIGFVHAVVPYKLLLPILLCLNAILIVLVSRPPNQC